MVGTRGLYVQVSEHQLAKDDHETFAQLIGPSEAKLFWNKFLDNYITNADIKYLKSIGVNSVRVPFNYRLFTNEDYLGQNDASRGFELLDKVINWCKKEDLYVILDMHCAPAGQTGDNIDDSYGYPFLFESEDARKLTKDIWKSIARKYSNEPIILGYDLLNEPIAHYFNKDSLNHFLVPFYKELTKEIRSVDQNHILFLGGAQWNTNFSVFNTPIDPNVVYTFHLYKDQPVKGSIQRFLDFRDKYNAPIYAGETGENTDEWIFKFRSLLDEHQIGWHFWPYKKMDSPKNIASVKMPENYNLVIDYAESPRNSYKHMRELKIDRPKIKKALNDYLELIKFENNQQNEGYIKALGFKSK
ncbi:glycoside hydrolase family 5 protein [Pedobacter sp. UC225_65]|uniref:glycoside hydrolase family 5 protein n=1 Tax=Pedobacter sp. UC225_65 TaxID=3350173 RepID=UPI00366F3C59